MSRTIDERTEFLDAVEVDFDEEEEMYDIAEWANGAPDRAAKYIMWLEKALQEDS